MSPGLETRQFEALLAAREQLLWVKIAAKLLAGIPLTLIPPAILATIFVVAGGGILGVYLPWAWLFAALTVVVVPLLLRTEIRMGERYLSDAVAGSDPAITLTTRLPFYAGLGGLALGPALANPRGFAAGVVEIFLIGPRLLVGALRQWRFRRRLDRIDGARAAELLATLPARNEGLPLAAVPRPGEQLNDLLPLLAWLAFHGWIGMGEKIDRVYLYSESRAALERAVGRVPSRDR